MQSASPSRPHLLVDNIPMGTILHKNMVVEICLLPEAAAAAAATLLVGAKQQWGIRLRLRDIKKE